MIPLSEIDVIIKHFNPLIIESYYENKYHNHGLRHRLNGAAFIHYDKYLNVTEKEYYIMGKQIHVANDEEFARYVKLQAFV